MQIGSYTLAGRALLAPMAGVTDLPFRRLCRSLGAEITVTEFVNVEGLLRGCAKARRKVTLYRGVYPIAFQITTSDHATLNREAMDELRSRGTVRDGDMVIITKGDLTGVMGGTNAMKIAVVSS